MATLEDDVHALYSRIGELSPEDGDAAKTIGEAIRLIDVGDVRVAEIDQDSDTVVVHEWLKEAILCYFRLSAMSTIDCCPRASADSRPKCEGQRQSHRRAHGKISAAATPRALRPAWSVPHRSSMRRVSAVAASGGVSMSRLLVGMIT